MTDKQNKKPSREQAEEAVRTLLSWIGEDPERSGLKRTPLRVLNSFADWYGGYEADPAAILGSSFPDADGYQGMVVLTDIDFESHCEHHMAPFIGKAHVAYMPADRVVGVNNYFRAGFCYDGANCEGAGVSAPLPPTGIRVERL